MIISLKDEGFCYTCHGFIVRERTARFKAALVSSCATLLSSWRSISCGNLELLRLYTEFFHISSCDKDFLEGEGGRFEVRGEDLGWAGLWRLSIPDSYIRESVHSEARSMDLPI